MIMRHFVLPILFTLASGQASCPDGWVDGGSLGCFLFQTEQLHLSWLEALEYCEQQGGFLAMPKSEEQLNFVTSLAYLEEGFTGIKGWWLGLTDLGHEGEWVWQFDREDASNLPWDTFCPDPRASNTRDCVALVSNSVPDRTLPAYFRDIQCTEPHRGFKIAPVCQRGGLEGTSTTTTTMAPLPTTGVVQSTNYPNNYPSNSHESTNVTVPVGSLIEVVFDNFFDIEAYNGDSCEFDNVTVVDADGTTLLPATCGHTKPSSFTSRSNQMTVVFTSDDSDQYAGFRLHWKSV